MAGAGQRFDIVDLKRTLVLSVLRVASTAREFVVPNSSAKYRPDLPCRTFCCIEDRRNKLTPPPGESLFLRTGLARQIEVERREGQSLAAPFSWLLECARDGHITPAESARAANGG
jgi:hypothetical protein